MNDNGQSEAPEAAKKQPTAGQIAALRQLTQGAAAWLLGYKSVRTLGDRTDAPRNDDGSYSGQSLVAWSLARMQSAELPDGDLEGALHLSAFFTSSLEGGRAGAVRILSGIQTKYGAAGLATVAELFLSELKLWREKYPSPYEQRPTPEEIRDECNQEAAARIANLPEWNARADCRAVAQCERCGKYRWGRRWLSPPWPRGYVALIALCPECEQKTPAINGHTND